MPALNLDVLNAEQRAAVLAPDGPILILAGAGSGKTRAITYRIAHLLGERNVDPREVLAVTFTNKAAGEMRERVAALIEGAQAPWVSTFHSACARILRAEASAVGYQQNYSILDEGDSMSVIRDVIEAAGLPDSPAPELARARFEQAKNEAISTDELAARAESGRDNAIAQLYRLYRERLRTINAMDFSDLQLLAYELFRDHPEILEKYQRRAAHLMVDEYQDTNRVQYLLVKALSARSGNICVVGDEDQSDLQMAPAPTSATSWISSTTFPTRKSSSLNRITARPRPSSRQRARSFSIIASARKKPSGPRTRAARRSPISPRWPSATRRILSRAKSRPCRKPTSSVHSEVVVFYRVNAQSRVIEEALVRRRLPYFVVGGHRFYELKENSRPARLSQNDRPVLRMRSQSRTGCSAYRRAESARALSGDEGNVGAREHHYAGSAEPARNSA